MSDQARIDSIDVLRDFRAAMCKFAEVATVALGDAESDISRTLMWLENEQLAYWNGQIRKRQLMVSRAAEKLREKRLFKDASGRIPATVDEERALKLAQRKLADAEEKLLTVRKYIRQMQKMIHDYKGSVQGFNTAVAHDIPLSVARLDKLSTLLGQYVDLTAPGAATEETTSAATGESMGRLGGASIDTKDSGVLDAAPAAEDLPDFPAFDPPQVVLVHTHLPTGLILSTDGKSPAEDGNQYRRFASVTEAEQYARVKLDTASQLEFAIYGHDKNRLMTIVRERTETP